MELEYDIIVVGAGHAGCEAAVAAARLGSRVLLITMDMEKVAAMSCNPAVGGVAKGQIVREIDALGGMTGIITDRSTIQFRMLGRSKGAAMWSPRAQCDKRRFSALWREVLENTPGLFMWQDSVVDLIVEDFRDGEGAAASGMVSGGVSVSETTSGSDDLSSERGLCNAVEEICDGVYSGVNDRADFETKAAESPLSRQIKGVRTALGVEFRGRAVILTAGTFLEGLIHVGRAQTEGGRIGEKASKGLTERLVSLGFEAGRMKTGTPARLDGRTIDFGRLEVQEGDAEPSKFSFSPETSSVQLASQLPCYIAVTSPEVHDVLRGGFADSPLFNGTIRGIGPRYCPSIEDKLRTFADKDSHQLFLEPEGVTTNEYYINGFSSSLPWRVQVEALQRISGLEHVHLFRPGYAIEYDYFPPTQLLPTLQTRLVHGLWFAGQINGTTGYEEAAAQGLMAGINAALFVAGRGSFSASRSGASRSGTSGSKAAAFADTEAAGVSNSHSSPPSNDNASGASSGTAGTEAAGVFPHRSLSHSSALDAATPVNPTYGDGRRSGGETLPSSQNASPDCGDDRRSGGDDFVLRRDEAYIGVLIDDLVTKGVDEPYRMFTSRAEYRILLRQDNADLRLTPKGREIGLVDDVRWAFFEQKKSNVESLRSFVHGLSIAPDDLRDYLISRNSALLTQGRKLSFILSRVEISLKEVADELPALRDFVASHAISAEEIEQVEIEIKYRGYIEREKLIAEKLHRLEEVAIPSGFDFTALSSLTMEARQKLTRIRPATIGQASRIPGVSPADINVLLVYFGR